MSFEITEDLIARQTPEAQLIIRLLLARIEELEARLGKSPQNSSLPPSSQHPHAKPPAKKKGSSPIFMADLPFRWNFSLPHVSLRA